LSDLILHHYAGSPFAEKIRLILGYKKLAWKSVSIPRIMPKPDVVALTGGYRRTPILQIGAHIYCDTALIAEVLERAAPAPSLYPPAQAAQARMIAHWADTHLFWTAIPYTMQPEGMKAIFAGASPEEIKAFGADRAAMRNNAPRMAAGEAIGQARVFVEWIDALFADGRTYACGDAPTIADFALYHPLWFILRAPPVAGILEGRERLRAWRERMREFRHGTHEDLSSTDAIAIARAATAAQGAASFADAHGFVPGERVRVMPSDYAFDPVEGELVISAPNEIAVRREDPRAGVVMVHFPRVGYQMAKAA
jgi:glutathione S-transferase